MTGLTEDLEHTITEFAMHTRDTVGRFLTRVPQTHGIPTLVSVWRIENGEHVEIASITTPADRDRMLMIASGARGGLAADVIVLTFDTYYARTELNPDTGQAWGPGQMQDCALNADGIKRKIVVDAMMVVICTRTAIWSVVLPYRRNRRTVHWYRADELGKEGIAVGVPTREMVGIVPEALRKIMALGTVEMTEFGDLPPGVDPQTLADLYTLRMLSRDGLIVGSEYYAEDANYERLRVAWAAVMSEEFPKEWMN